MNEQIINIVKLKNNKGEDIYSVDKVGDYIVVSPVKPLIDVFDDLTLYDVDLGNICEINISEILLNTMMESIKNKTGVDTGVKVKFRKIEESFPEIVNQTAYTYVQPNKKETKEQPYVRETPKVGRNNPCPCGSGDKYKKCCGE